jgi:DNA-directed RNA polymerase subunit RPC12/RpoP
MIHSMSNWGRGPYVPVSYNECAKLGYHRLGQLHGLSSDKSIMYQVCRRCGSRFFYKYTLIDGKLTETLLDVKRNGQHLDSVSDDKPSPDSGEEGPTATTGPDPES